MHAAFEFAIRQEPDEAAHYAAYGDWLHERGDPRGDFIQVQLALEDETLAPARRAELRAREAELLGQHEAAWLGPLAPFTKRDGGEEENTHRWARGFLHSMTIRTLPVALGRALRDSDEARLLRELAIDTADENYDFDRGELAVEDDLPPDRDEVQYFTLGLYPILRAPVSFPCLRSFRFGYAPPYGRFEDERWIDSHSVFRDMPALIERMPRLEELALHCKDYDIRRVFASSSLERLRILRICHLGQHKRDRRKHEYPYPLNRLAANSAFANLTHLLMHPHYDELHGSFLPLDQVRAVVTSPVLTKLTHLQARLSDMGDDGCRMLVETGAFRRLRWLDLRHGCITDEGARVLAACPDIGNLAHLDLSRNAVTAAGLALLRDAGVNAFADSPLTEQELAERVYLHEGDFE
ncbi:MAG: TIGR02996 domain-containing protein [Gemmataceae bacterium]|nr:TIGR02996 domain-containing protein [Gemmataceae bacterium]